MLLSHHQKARQNHSTDAIVTAMTGVRLCKTTKRSFENLTIQIFGNGSNKSKFDSGENNN
jgi:hypothetical protein